MKYILEITPGNFTSTIAFDRAVTLAEFMDHATVKAEIRNRLSGQKYDILVGGTKMTLGANGGLTLNTEWETIILSKDVKGAQEGGCDYN